MNKAKLLPPAERAARVAEKREKVLRFLKDEIFTNRIVAQQLLGLNSRQAVYTTLGGMERDGLIKRDTLPLPGGHQITLWGITPAGQLMAFNPNTEAYNDRYFEPGRVGLTVLDHTLDLQLLRLQAEAAGWTGWTLGDRIGKWQKGQSRPDAVATDPQGVRWAIECERTIKTRKRYEAILKDRLLAIKQGAVNKVAWLCPEEEQAGRLRAAIKSVPETAEIRMLKEGLHSSLIFSDYRFFSKGK